MLYFGKKNIYSPNLQCALRYIIIFKPDFLNTFLTYAKQVQNYLIIISPLNKNVLHSEIFMDMKLVFHIQLEDIEFQMCAS